MVIYWNDIWNQLLEHIEMSFLALIISTLIGIGIGILVYKTKFAKTIFVNGSAILQVIPSITLFGVLLPTIDDLLLIVLITLSLYGIFPILSNTIVALNNIEKKKILVAKSLGMNEWNIIWKIRFRGNLSTIINGIRISSILIIGTTSIAFSIGAGGLGEIIYQGITLKSVSLVMQGTIPIILLSLTTFGIISLIKWSFSSKNNKKKVANV
ncbi:MAG: ABC transporter permease [Mollicutes bacterium PWAP]|nr:ABC transporter permease [Mollicutes bacterium PWAP]